MHEGNTFIVLVVLILLIVAIVVRRQPVPVLNGTEQWG
jgi:hypothetical protein